MKRPHHSCRPTEFSLEKERRLLFDAGGAETAKAETAPTVPASEKKAEVAKPETPKEVTKDAKDATEKDAVKTEENQDTLRGRVDAATAKFKQLEQRVSTAKMTPAQQNELQGTISAMVNFGLQQINRDFADQPDILDLIQQTVNGNIVDADYQKLVSSVSTEQMEKAVGSLEIIAKTVSDTISVFSEKQNLPGLKNEMPAVGPSDAKDSKEKKKNALTEADKERIVANGQAELKKYLETENKTDTQKERCLARMQIAGIDISDEKAVLSGKEGTLKALDGAPWELALNKLSGFFRLIGSIITGTKAIFTPKSTEKAAETAKETPQAKNEREGIATLTGAGANVLGAKIYGFTKDKETLPSKNYPVYQCKEGLWQIKMNKDGEAAWIDARKAVSATFVPGGGDLPTDQKVVVDTWTDVTKKLAEGNKEMEKAKVEEKSKEDAAEKDKPKDKPDGEPAAPETETRNFSKEAQDGYKEAINALEDGSATIDEAQGILEMKVNAVLLQMDPLQKDLLLKQIFGEADFKTGLHLYNTAEELDVRVTYESGQLKVRGHSSKATPEEQRGTAIEETRVRIGDVIRRENRHIQDTEADRKSSGRFGKFNRFLTGSDPYEIEIKNSKQTIGTMDVLQQFLDQAGNETDPAKQAELINKARRVLGMREVTNDFVNSKEAPTTRQRSVTGTEHFDVEQDAITVSEKTARDAIIAVGTAPLGIGAAGIKGAIRVGAEVGAASAGLASTYENTVAVKEGKKTVGDAIKDVAADTGRSAVVGAAFGVAGHGAAKGLGKVGERVARTVVYKKGQELAKAATTRVADSVVGKVVGKATERIQTGVNATTTRLANSLVGRAAKNTVGLATTAVNAVSKKVTENVVVKTAKKTTDRIQNGLDGVKNRVNDAVNSVGKKISDSALGKRVKNITENIRARVAPKAKSVATESIPSGMKKFEYEAMDNTGLEIKDSISAVSEAEAQLMIKKRGFFTTKIKEAGIKEAGNTAKNTVAGLTGVTVIGGAAAKAGENISKSGVLAKGEALAGETVASIRSRVGDGVKTVKEQVEGSTEEPSESEMAKKSSPDKTSEPETEPATKKDEKPA